ncbi:4Fe-4S binding protein [Geobacter grbiciae]|uniref:4Fe-4S binding protein n=1 Tax=Geobacter grbiciae TaxID=155042 RepID=UPI001C00FEEF|nr:4Fe-4S binding protein [Geobacter grbiciae]MBT1076338.1 4Fe-4S binding protein [Geobacter grbiciae]
MNKPNFHSRIPTWRALVQWGFFAWVVVIGIRFGAFVRHFETGGATPLVTRPPGVEGFLPIGALASTKLWLATGTVNPVHPAALVIFLTIVGMSLVAKKSFCSWLCPVGTLSEAAWKLGRRLFGRNFRVWPWLDVALRGVKYLLLLFFVKLILIDMPALALSAFLDAPYWAVSDVKMLHFFTNMSATTVVILAILTGLSFFYKNAWCRYLCPYGALLGVASYLSPFKIRRDTAGCTGCLTCVASCPERDVLRMAPPFWRRPLPAWVFPALVVLLFVAGIGTGMATGNWHSSLSADDYRRLIPMVPYLSH